MKKAVVCFCGKQLPSVALGEGAQEESNCCQTAERECEQKAIAGVGWWRKRAREENLQLLLLW